MSVTGADKFLAKLAGYPERITGAVEAATYQWALMVENTAKRRTPVDTGRLRASYYVELPRFSGTAIELRFGCGTNYALAVHNRSGARHPVGQDHFLSSAFDEAKGGAFAWIAAKAAENAKRGRTLQGAAEPTQPREGEELAKHAKRERRKALKERGGK